MISYIVASNNPRTLKVNLLDTLECYDGDEIVIVENPPSIAAAYNEGTARSVNQIKCYVHHDVQIVDSGCLRAELIRHCTEDTGIVGVIGTKVQEDPWWVGEEVHCGSIVDGRGMGYTFYSTGDEFCAYLDGVILATAQDVTWDESYTGFHYYDYDICRQMIDRGLRNYCLSWGKDLIVHNTSGSSIVGEIPGWQEAQDRFRKKWG